MPWKHPRHLRKREYPLNRTFDLAFFSEKAILILEAKAQQGLKGKQLEGLQRDLEWVQDLTQVDNVWVYGLVSSRYNPRPKTRALFDGPLLTWFDLAQKYDGDEVLERADALYGDENLTGEQLVAAYRMGAEFWVGRIGGLTGNMFSDDLESGDWKKHRYRTSFQKKCPGRYWFELSEFATAVKETGSTRV